MKFSLKFTLLFLVCLILFPFVFAQESVPPINVHQFYGDVINGLDGDVVKAVVNDNEFTTTVSNGQYGYSPTFNVEGGITGATVVFYINDVETSTAVYDEQGLTNLDLTRPASAPPSNGDGDGDGNGAPSGNGGGGGGGSFWRSFQQQPTPAEQAQCVEDWVCDSWSDCVAGQQSRECIDQEACGTELLKPAEVKSCEVTPIVLPEEITPPSLPVIPKKIQEVKEFVEEKVEGLGWLWLPIILILILIAIAFIFGVLYLIKRRKGERFEFKETLTKTTTAATAPIKRVGQVVSRPFARPKPIPGDRLAPLRAYVQKTRAMGYNKSQIRQVLVKAGWRSSDIAVVLGAQMPVKRASFGRTIRRTPARARPVKRTFPVRKRVGTRPRAKKPVRKKPVRKPVRKPVKKTSVKK